MLRSSKIKIGASRSFESEFSKGLNALNKLKSINVM